MKQSELPLTASPVSKVVRIALTPGQVEQLTPLAIKAGLERKNVLFVTSVVPSWSTEEGETTWELQVVTISTPLGSKIVGLIRGALNPPPDKPDTTKRAREGGHFQVNVASLTLADLVVEENSALTTGAIGEYSRTIE